MTDLEWPTWDADQYTYRIMSPPFVCQTPDGKRRPYDAWGELQIVTHEFLSATRLSRSQLRAFLVRPVIHRVERETGRLLDAAEVDVALIDDRFPNRPLAREVGTLRDLSIRDELRKQAR